MKTMRAYRMLGWGQPPRMQEIPVPEPGPGEARLKVAGNGICQSDLHMIHDWPASPPHLDINLPMTIGHEISGTIDRCGPGVRGLEAGQPCLVTLAGCGRCRPCLAGWNNYCTAKPRQPGIGLDGGLADYVIAPLECLVPFDGIEPWQAAPLTDAGLSSWHAVKRVLGGLGPGTTAVVIGIGGLGHMAVAALKASCAARIVAVDPSEAARALALRLGADQAIAPDELDRIGATAQAVLDFVGSGDTVAAGARAVAPLGHVVVVGRGPGHFEFTHSALRHGARLSTTFGGSRGELSELLALMKAGAIQPELTRFSLDDAETALALLAEGKISGRAVICP